MVKYICKNCMKEFNRKSNYDYHIENKKKPCVPLHQNPPKTTKTHQFFDPNFSSNTQLGLVDSIENLSQSDSQDSPTCTNLQTNPQIYKSTTKCEQESKLSSTNNMLDNVKSNRVHKCEYCSLTFSRQDALKRHIDSRCKIKNKDKNKENNNTDEKNIQDKEMKKNKQNDVLLKKIKNLEKVIEEMKTNNKTSINKVIINANNNSTNTTNNNSNTTNTTNINNSTNTVNIKLKAFGDTDLSRIDLETKLNFLNTVDFPNIIPNYAKYAFINDKMPENRNFKVLDIARNKCEYYDGQKWIKDDANKCTIQMLDYLKDSLQDLFNKENIEKTIKFIKKNEEKLSQKYINCSKNFCYNLDKIDDKEYKNHRENIAQQLRYIFYNHKDEILS
jgi:hypothetical protein